MECDLRIRIRKSVDLYVGMDRSEQYMILAYRFYGGVK